MYESTTRLDLDPNRLVLGKGDFAAALNKVIPASRRGVSGTPARPLDSISANLLKAPLKAIMWKIKNVLPAHGVQAVASHMIASTSHVDTLILESETPPSEADMLSAREARITQRVQEERLALEIIPSNSEAWIAALTDMQDMESPKVSDQYESDNDQYEISNDLCKIDNSVLWDAASITSYPRLVIVGLPGLGQNDLAAAAIQQLEGMPCFAIDLPALLADLNAQ